MKSTLLNFLLIPIILVFTMSCEKKNEDPGLGPQAFPIDIEIAQNKSLAKLDPYTAKAGQKVHKVETQEIVTSQGLVKSLSKEFTTELTEVENFTDRRLLTTLKKVIDYREKDIFVYEIKNVFALPQLDNNVEAMTNESIAKEFGIHPMAVNRKVTEAEIEGVSFHNLSQKEVVMVPPERVLDSVDCRNLSPCEIKADMIVYDIVFHLDDGSNQKHQMEWFISADVPFFAGILKQCATTLVPVEDLRVLVKQCNEVVDFNE